MTPHQVLALLTQDQTADLLVACCQYLAPDRILSCLRQGLEKDELLALHTLLHDYHCVDSDDEER